MDTAKICVCRSSERQFATYLWRVMTRGSTICGESSGSRSRKGNLLTVRRPCHHSLAWRCRNLRWGHGAIDWLFLVLISTAHNPNGRPGRCESDVFSVRRPAGRRIAGSTSVICFAAPPAETNYPRYSYFAIVGLIDGSEHESNVAAEGDSAGRPTRPARNRSSGTNLALLSTQL